MPSARLASPVSYPIAAWLDAFAFTQIVEVPVYVLAIRHAQRAGWSERPRELESQVLLAFGASAITHPMVWYLIPRVVDPYRHYGEYVAFAESFAVLVEAFYLRSLHVVWLRRALVISLVANALSAGLGELCRRAFGFP
jgi:hypothetical protein